MTLQLLVWDEDARGANHGPLDHRMPRVGNRDYERKRGTLESMETLDQTLRAFHAAATQILGEAPQVLERLGPLQEIGMRLARIEGAVGSRAGR